jgi:hypothetical protein
MAKKKKEETNPSLWQNRIVGHGVKAAKDFKFNPGNWREHGKFQREALNGSLSEIGWVTGVIENISTGNLIDGHARVEEALQQGPDTPVPFIQVELSEDEEKKILAVLDPISALATTNSDKLKELTSMLEFQSGALAELIELRQSSDLNLEEFFQDKLIEPAPEKFSIVLEYSKEDYARVMTGLNEIASQPAEAVKHLLEL